MISQIFVLVSGGKLGFVFIMSGLHRFGPARGPVPTRLDEMYMGIRVVGVFAI